MDDLGRIARSIRLVSLDCDGVMTDGRLYYGDDGTQMRAFHVRDGVGIKMLMDAGIKVAFITGSRTQAIERRAKDLGVAHCLTGIEDKLAALQALCGGLGIGLEAVAHLGDDVNDLPVLARVGLPATVWDSMQAVRAAARIVTARAGGDGAVREFCERLLDARAAPV